jgi:hypothetical protein
VSPKLGLVVKSSNTATGGQEYLDVDDGPSLVFLLEGWFGAGLRRTTQKEDPTMELSVPDIRVGCFLGLEKNGVSSREGGKVGPGPPSGKKDMQSAPNKEGGNMEQEEEGRTGQVWWRRASVHRVSIFKKVFVIM